MKNVTSCNKGLKAESSQSFSVLPPALFGAFRQPHQYLPPAITGPTSRVPHPT
jgi:hypothetical protein